MRLLRILFGILGWVLILCLLALAGVVALVTTEQGTRWLFDQAERHAPVEFRFEGVEGTLFRGLSLDGLQVDAGGTRVQLEHGRIQVDALPLLQLTLRIRELTLAGARVDLPEADPEPPEPTTPFELPEAIEIPLRLVLERFSLTDLRLFRAGETLFELDRLALRLEADSQTLRVADLQLEMPDLEAGLDAELQPAGDYPLRLDGHWRFALPGALAKSLDAAHAEGVLTADGTVRGPLRIGHRLEAGIALDTQLLLDDLLGSPHIALENHWAPFRYRIEPETLIEIDAGELTLQGGLDDWTLEALTGLRVDDLPPVRLEAALDGSAQEAEIRRLNAILPADGLLSVTGRVSYAAGIEWDLQVSGRDIDPGVILPDLTGRLALDLRSRGALPPEDALRAEVELTELSGMLLGQPLDGVATVALSGTRVQVDRLDLGMGANRLSASGSIDEALDLSLMLDAPELDRILPELAGRIRLDASLGGRLESPTITARGEGAGLRHGELALDAFSLRLDAGLDPEAPAELALRLSGLRAGAITVAELRADAGGRASAHRLTLAVDAADMGRVDLRATGGYDLDRSRWEGQLERLDLSQPLAGDWSLQRPVSISAGPDRARLGELCVGREQSRICADGEWDAVAGAQGQASIQDLDLLWLSPFLPPETGIDGRLDARAQGTLDPDARLRAELVLPPAAGTLRFELADGTPQTVPYSDLRLSVRVDDRSVDADAGLSFLEDGELSVSARLRPEGDTYRIDGRLQAGLKSLGWAGALSPAIQDVRGRLQADIELGGLLNAPLVAGGIRLDDGAVTIPDAGITLEIPLLQADVISAEEMRLAGELRSGDGSLSVEGELGFPDQRPRAEIRIQGERFLAVDRPDIRATINPDLTVSFVPELLTVRGEILVPSALIRPPDLPPGSVTVSRDEVIIGVEDEPDTGLPMDIRVRVVLGDDVRFDGFDLEARVTGDLDVVDLPGRPLQVFGNVEIPEGRYEAWGQDLTLERGLVIFQGPVESPALDLRAVRRVRAYDVVVGVEIGGTPDALQSRITSEPPMDDTEAMSFLLTGRPLSGAGERDGSLIAGAAAAWGLEQAGLITERLGRELGLDVELDADDGLDQSALTIGTYLSPRLLLRYSVGLFDGSNRIMLRYELTRSLSVETTSGADGQGIDLIYRIER